MIYSIGDYGDMIADKVRMDPYVFALKEVVKPGSVVLDIGTGSGVHALLACKFGARKVYALEPNDAILLAAVLARENGFDDRIEFIQDISTQVSLPEKADVIVSDLRGVLPLYGRHIPAIIDARERHLAPGGVLIPKHDTIWVSLIEARGVYHELTAPWDFPYGLSMRSAKKIILNDWSEENTGTFNKRSLLMEPQVWTEIDYASIDNPDVVSSRITQQSSRDGTAHGFLMWFDGEIAEGIRVFNGPSAEKAAEVYGCAFFPLLEPVSIDKGDTIYITMKAELVDGQYRWTWHTGIQSGDNPLALKANFDQSTSLNSMMNGVVVHERIRNNRPIRSENAAIDHFILGKMSGGNTLDMIAKLVREEYPMRFKTQNEAEFYVNGISILYSQ